MLKLSSFGFASSPRGVSSRAPDLKAAKGSAGQLPLNPTDHCPTMSHVRVASALSESSVAQDNVEAPWTSLNAETEMKISKEVTLTDILSELERTKEQVRGQAQQLNEQALQLNCPITLGLILHQS